MMTNTGNRVTQGQFSFLPDLTDAQITAQIEYALDERLGGRRRVHRRSASAQHLLGDVRQPDVRPARIRPAILMEINELPQDVSRTTTSA